MHRMALDGASVLVQDIGDTCLTTSATPQVIGDNPAPGRWSAMPKARLVITALFGTSVWPASSPEACAVRVDRLWDTTKGRMIPGPVKPHDRSHDRRIAQYFLVDPHLPDD